MLDEPVQGILADPDLGLDSTGHPEVTFSWREAYTTSVQMLASLKVAGVVSICFGSALNTLYNEA